MIEEARVEELHWRDGSQLRVLIALVKDWSLVSSIYSRLFTAACSSAPKDPTPLVSAGIQRHKPIHRPQHIYTQIQLE